MDILAFWAYEILSSLLPLFVALMIFRVAQKKKGITFSKGNLLMIVVFSIYVYGVYHFTGAGTIYDGIRYQFELPYQINIIPFSKEIDIVSYLLNILLFIPLGVIVPIVWKKMQKLTNVIGIGFFFTILIEISQLLNNRRTDIDDIILNILGAVIGYGIFKLFNKITKSKFQVNSPLTNELPIYIVVIFLGRFLLFNEFGLAKLLYGF